MTGKSFRGCLLYCLNDKKDQAKNNEAAMKDRAEVLLYNKCYGNARELMTQFNDVRNLNNRVSKPVLHITLSLAPGEKLGRDKLMEICQHCAKDMGFEHNQYVAIHHKDTRHQHIHIVANRIGFDGKTVSDSRNYQRMVHYCRKMEHLYGLKKVLSPRKFLPREQQILPRMDERKLQLRNAIESAIEKSHNYQQFEAQMNSLGYQVHKARGIAFTDSKKVRTKGSEVGYSLSTLERIFEWKQKQTEKATRKNLSQLLEKTRKPKGSMQEHAKGEKKARQQDHSQQESRERKPDLIDALMRPEHVPEQQLPFWLREKKRKKRKGHHL